MRRAWVTAPTYAPEWTTTMQDSTIDTTRLPDTRRELPAGRAVYMSGIEALVQLPMLQHKRDAAAGLNTAGFISGYRGSPLGTLDMALWKQRKRLAENHVVFQPGVNEELAMTAVWGSQQVNLFEGAKYDGVFALWYGKGPGLDRSVDVLKHGNAAGSSAKGGVLVVVGDDHGAKSSTLPHQSDHVFSAAMVPVLNPCNVQEFIDYGLHGWAMSRFSGCWVGMRAIADTVETSSSIYLDPDRIVPRIPPEIVMPPDGVNLRWPDRPLDQELRLHEHKIYAAIAYARENGLNQVVIDSPQARLGIITTGKSYLDVRQALAALGIDDATAAAIGLRVLKVGMTWPLDPEGVRSFAAGLEEVLVVEEKRQVLEYQLKEELYNWREDVRPRVVGKFDDSGEWVSSHRWQLPAAGELTAAMIARVIASRIAQFHSSAAIEDRLAFLEGKEAALAKPRTGVARVPHYCSGCPHNTSTRVPVGSRALAGIGCHYMATWLNAEQTQTFSQMGGEGVPWVGQAPFTETSHVFANLGDGTYAHSGLLAIRQAVAAGVNITYKILYNDAVAMTGGQAVEGGLTVLQIVRQVQAEGASQVVVVTDEPEKYGRRDLPADVRVHHRRVLDAVQRELRAVSGTTILVYDQTCAAEKRRRRKRGTYPDPAKRVVINERVCEGCGDCSQTSNCMSVAPLETEFGRKREIDQSSCNKDFSCADGFCPSFVTVNGGKLRRGVAPDPVGGLGAAGGLADHGGLEAPEATASVAAADEGAENLPQPVACKLDHPYGILITGVGGTGVVTIGALLGTAAAIEGLHATALDMAGLAQKGGPVWSHIRIARRQDHLFASRIAAGEADLVLGCDIVTAVSDESLAKMREGVTRAVINADFSVTSDFVRGFAAQSRTGDVSHVRDPQFPRSEMERQIEDAVGVGRMDAIGATRMATALLGDSIATNLMMLGYAWQKGLVPLSEASLMQAIEKNGAAVAMNKRAFRWGRRAAVDLASVEAAASPQYPAKSSRVLSATIEEVIARRADDLTAYQNRAYADRYAQRVERARIAEAANTPGQSEFSDAVARYLYKLMAVKDEYEVARLYTQTGFIERLRGMFEGDFRISFNLAPPVFGERDATTGLPRKREFGPWMLQVFRLLARLKGLRGTAFDVFGRTEERRTDRALLAEYEALIDDLCTRLTPQNHAVAVELAALPEQIRGYGHIRARHIVHATERRRALIDQLNGLGANDRPPDGSVKRARTRVIMAG
jgi:indolepyruvate ferredoxin oxidoreductase